MQLDQHEIKSIAESVVQEIKPLLLLILKNEKPQDGPFMDVAALAAYMGVSTAFIYKLTSDKEIPHFKKGRKFISFRKSEIDMWLEQYHIPAVQKSKRMAKLVEKKAETTINCHDH